jgi:phenylacetate-CoA ligase
MYKDYIKKIIDTYRKNRFIRIIPFSFTRTNDFKKNYEFLQKAEKFSADEVAYMQYKSVKSIIKYAYNYVPFYKKKYSEIGFEPQDFTSIEVIKKLPAISKKDIKENYDDFISDEIKKIKSFSCQSSGTSSYPMKFYQDYSILEKDSAYHYYIWKMHGYNVGERCIVLRGHTVANIQKKIFWSYDKISNYKIFDSSYINNQEFFDLYNKEIKKFKARVLFGYPSSIYSLAKAYQKSNFTPPTFDIICMSSENTYAYQNDLIKSVFNVKILTYNYGLSERVLLANKYMDNDNLGFFPLYGYFELLDDYNTSITTNNTLGEITGTSFSKSMPFIRYKTNDFTSLNNYKSNDFMKNCISINKIEGRRQEFFIKSDGGLASLCTIAGAHFEELCKLDEMQYYQEKAGELIVKGVEDDRNPLTEQDKASLINKIEEKYNWNIIVKYRKVDSIERTKSGKKMMLIQTLNLENDGIEE